MFAQKPPNIKKAILNFLRGINIRTEKEIIENVRDFSKSATPERSINRTLNELFKKGRLQKIYLKDGNFFTWETLKPEDRKKRFPRFYKLISEQYRKGISTTMYIGTNQTGNQDSNPNYNPDSNRYSGADKSPRKTPTDLKAWLFDDIENRDENRFDVLSEFLYDEMKKSRLSLDSADGVFTQFFPVPYMAGTNKSKSDDNISLDEFRAILGSDMVMPFQDKDDKIFNPKTKKPMFWSARGVEQ
jgi:hypothetical protein